MASISKPRAESQTKRGTLSRRDARLGYLMVAPVTICLLVLVVYPFLFAIWISFTDRMIGREGKFVGLANYAYLAGQSSFQASIINTIVLVVSVQALKLVLGLGIAILLNRRFAGATSGAHWCSCPGPCPPLSPT